MVQTPSFQCFYFSSSSHLPPPPPNSQSASLQPFSVMAEPQLCPQWNWFLHACTDLVTQIEQAKKR